MIKCRKCGFENSDVSKFCQQCGTNLTEETVACTDVVNGTVNVQVKEKIVTILKILKRKRKIVIPVCCVILLVVVIVIFYNSTHCHYSKCDNATVDRSKYCYIHKCSVCNERVYAGSNYCYSHYLLYDKDAKNSSQSTTRDLKISNVTVKHNSSYTVVTGKVTNNGSSNYKFIRVKGAFKNSSGKVVDTDHTYAIGSEGLAPGESTTFRMSVKKDASITKCDVTFMD